MTKTGSSSLFYSQIDKKHDKVDTTKLNYIVSYTQVLMKFYVSQVFRK